MLCVRQGSSLCSQPCSNFAAYCNEVNFCYLCCVKVRINRGRMKTNNPDGTLIPWQGNSPLPQSCKCQIDFQASSLLRALAHTAFRSILPAKLTIKTYKMEEKNVFIGIDFSKKTFDVAVMDGKCRRFPNSEAGCDELRGWLGQDTKAPPRHQGNRSPNAPNHTWRRKDGQALQPHRLHQGRGVGQRRGPHRPDGRLHEVPPGCSKRTNRQGGSMRNVP